MYSPLQTPLALEPLLSFFTRSSCTLTTLSWNDIPIKDEDWSTLLHSIPLLETLLVVDGGGDNAFITDSFFEELQWPSHSWASPMLPALNNLSLVLKFSELWTMTPVIQALQSRWLPKSSSFCDDIVCLKSFKLEMGPAELEKNFMVPLKQLSASGMKIVIRIQEEVILC
ncbi:hypothetical protein C8J56DRAFT_774223 [Mycena floridula]|nr:hypothetical protein C8J56DRAFT_774223 [Mycena floridula]